MVTLIDLGLDSLYLFVFFVKVLVPGFHSVFALSRPLLEVVLFRLPFEDLLEHKLMLI